MTPKAKAWTTAGAGAALLAGAAFFTGRTTAPEPPAPPAPIVVAATPPPPIAGFIDATGYHPPPNVNIHWTHPSPSMPPKDKRLDESMPCVDSPGATCIERYGEGDETLVGYQGIPAMSGEARGGEVYAALDKRYEMAGLPFHPTWM